MLQDQVAGAVNLNGTAADEVVLARLVDLFILIGGLVVRGSLFAHPASDSAAVGIACFLRMLAIMYSLTSLHPSNTAMQQPMAGSVSAPTPQKCCARSAMYRLAVKLEVGDPRRGCCR